MTNIDTIIDRLNDHPKPYGGVYSEAATKILTEFKQAVIAEAQRWTPVSEKLPENGQLVIAMYKGVYEPRIVPYWFDGVNSHFGRVDESQPATHWMPAPQSQQ
jgi:Protein of unknown function (DUF551)